MFDTVAYLRCLTLGGSHAAEALALIESVRFENPSLAWKRLQAIASTPEERELLARAMPALLAALNEAATPDLSLVNLDRYLRSGTAESRPLQFLAENPRAVEILVRLFVGSQYLTEILLQNPDYLARLTQYNRLSEIKSRQQFYEEGLAASSASPDWPARMTALRHFQKWELLRIAACDTFGLMDFKATTLQLSLLADGIVQLALWYACQELRCPAPDFCVLAMGKLGGEELNYSSDIDLVFVCEADGGAYSALAQRLIRGLSDMTATGFLYRVDMRLRPWGKAGALVTTRQAYLDYIRKDGRLWEKQALLKARPIAGNMDVGFAVLNGLNSQIFQVDAELARQSVLTMKRDIEDKLAAQGLLETEIKGGRGGIRDIEFTTQYLQLVHGGQHPGIHSINTLDSLVRLVNHDFIQADDYRQLTSGYLFLRTVEHSLQLLHNKQEHALPKSQRELACLAQRLDFPGPAEFMAYHDRHRESIRRVFDKYVQRRASATATVSSHASITQHLGGVMDGYAETFNEAQQQRHLPLLEALSPTQRVRVAAVPIGEQSWELTIVGYDEPGELSVICGLLLSHGMNIESGDVFTGNSVGGPSAGTVAHRKFIDVLQVRARGPLIDAGAGRSVGFSPRVRDDTAPAWAKAHATENFSDDFWSQYEAELESLTHNDHAEARAANQGRLARRVASLVEFEPDAVSVLLPLEIEFDNAAAREATVLRISGEDTLGFLYELANALTLSGIQIQRVAIRSVGQLASDTLHVTDESGRKITDTRRLVELRAAVILIKHFTHLLPQSPNPEAALLHFRELLVKLFERPDWSEQVASLDRTEVLGALSRLLGMSDFLGEELLRQELGRVLPIVTDSEMRREPKPIDQLRSELDSELQTAEQSVEERGMGVLPMFETQGITGWKPVPRPFSTGSETLEAQRQVLNAFKDREMLRGDMRNVLGQEHSFTEFSQELTDIAEVTVAAAWRCCENELRWQYGSPLLASGVPCRVSICALGKSGGRELGFASDIELMFLYEGTGHTTGPELISSEEFYDRLVDLFVKSIHSRRKGIFEIDLQLRPHGKAGSRAVSIETFERYFGPTGPAWPYERQALVKLRPIAGDAELGQQIVSLRDELIYTGAAFDPVAMRALRDKQLNQLVTPGTFNAKLSPGGLVDIEYLVQGLQLQHGAEHPSVRHPNTREAMKALEIAGVLSAEQRLALRDAYRFLRRLIDALRMVRGDAMDLTVPPRQSEEFRFLARRMQLFKESMDLSADLESYTALVRDLSQTLLP